MEQIYKYHHTDQYELFAYSRVDRNFNHAASQAIFWSLAFCHLNDTQLISQILKDNIDILIDLTGHTAENRVSIFNHRIAPVQASYIIGSGTTTGLPHCDFIIGDESLFSKDLMEYIPESLASLHCGYLYKGPHFEAGQVSTSPCEKNGFITFGCLSRSIRLNEEVIDTWCQILQLNPTSKLILDQKAYAFEDVKLYF